jgi:isoleucyl-tRNA synthetase
MVFDQVKIEKEVLAYWKKNNIYQKAKEQNRKEKQFYFCDGPPYATGQIHTGTAWNKCLKDAFCRYWRMKGLDVRAQPGYDTHGLPIELKVEQEMGIKNKREIESLGVANFTQKCKAFATKYINVISGQFERCGVWMDWEKPYVTYQDDYIEAAWGTIKAAHAKGLLAEGTYVVPYCARCETTLANYELEYQDQNDPSIYVKFKVAGTENEYLVIWTTTPWTLVSNMAVMVHPTYAYVKAKVGTEVWIVAKERLDALMAFEPFKSAVIMAELSGKKLEGMKYEHPLQDKIGKKYERKVVLSDEYVSAEDGSGLVHCAPGHGPEDYVIGKRFGIEIFSPVDAAGKYTADAGEYVGIGVRDANERIIADLEAAGSLIHSGKVMHSYPHCWRCKTPLIFIATPQWFIQITKQKERMLEEIENVRWQPEFAKTRFRDFVTSAPDWCISRQRYWGIPLPIWRCQACAKIKLVSSRAELPHVQELHRPYIDEVKLTCECGGSMHRVPDILDVWFDSGNCVWASLGKDERVSAVKADFILEGKDQTRGWFYSLLGSGTVLNNEAPYKTVLMHGFFVDEKGEKMSKSVGNFVALEEVTEKYGADAFRLWALTCAPWDDLRFNVMELKEAHRTLGIIFNVGVFLERFVQKPHKVAASKLEIEDKWLYSRMNSTVKAASEHMEALEPHKACSMAVRFLVDDVSRFYMKILKKRMDDGRAVSAGLQALYDAMLTSMRLLAPFAPFISEHVYQKFYAVHEKKESVHLLGWPEAEQTKIDSLLETQMEIAQSIIISASNARQKANVKLRWPLGKLHVQTSSTEASNAVERLATVIEGMCNVEKIALDAKLSPKIEIRPNRAKIGAAYKAESAKALSEIEGADAGAVAKALSENGKFVSGKFEFTSDMVGVEETLEGFALGGFDAGRILLDVRMDEKLLAAAMVREVARRIQLMRKEMGLVEADNIEVEFECKDSELAKIVEKHRKELAEEVNAKKVSEGAAKGGKDWEIEEWKIRIIVKKV